MPEIDFVAIDAQMCSCSHRRGLHSYAAPTKPEVTGIGLGVCGADWPDNETDIQGTWSSCDCPFFQYTERFGSDDA